jgi:hypothetical protein
MPLSVLQLNSYYRYSFYKWSYQLGKPTRYLWNNCAYINCIDMLLNTLVFTYLFFYRKSISCSKKGKWNFNSNSMIVMLWISPLGDPVLEICAPLWQSVFLAYYSISQGFIIPYFLIHTYWYCCNLVLKKMLYLYHGNMPSMRGQRSSETQHSNICENGN